jgi:hypothetical protein
MKELGPTKRRLGASLKSSRIDPDWAGGVRRVATALPVPVKRLGISAAIFVRRPTNKWRRLPNCLVIGAQRAGTTSLYNYLAQHPQVKPPLRKEIDYFSLNYHRGLSWYRAHFPMGNESSTSTLDATPTYLHDLRCAGRAAEVVPDAKILVVLRDPVERAFSHYKLMVERGLETLPFDEALDAEAIRLSGEDERMEAEPDYVSYAQRRYAYRGNGLYFLQLEQWLAHYPRERVLVLFSNNLYSDTQETMKRVLTFLELQEAHPKSYLVYSFPMSEKTSSLRLSDETRRQLTREFQEADNRLATLLETNLPWRS